MRLVIAAIGLFTLAFALFLVQMLVGLNYYGEGYDGSDPWGLTVLLWASGLSLLLSVVLLVLGISLSLNRRRAE